MKRRAGLFRKYAAIFVFLVSGGLLTSGALEMYFSYRENKAALGVLQHEKALAAASRIEQFIREIQGQLGWTAQPALAPGATELEARRLDLLRLLRQAPSITEVAYLNGAGREQLRVSRLAMDVVGSQTDRSQEPAFREAQGGRIYFGPVYFRKESEPYMSISLGARGSDAGVTSAEVNLKFIWEVVSRITVGKAGYAYVVDDRGQLIAHPDISLVLKKTSLASLGHVKSALTPSASASTGAAAEDAIVAMGPDGTRVLSAHAGVAPLHWTVFVEQPLTEAFAPLRSSLWRTALLLVLGVGISAGAGFVTARRMVRPIRELESGAARIGAGALEHRIQVRTGDELEGLAAQLNGMAAQLQDSYAGLERKVEARTQELTEALEQQTATSEVLKVISRSTFDLQPVLDTLLENAARLCEAKRGQINRLEGDAYRLAAVYNTPPEFQEYLRRHPMRPGRGTITGRAALERRAVQIPDVLTDPEYAYGEGPHLGGYRTLLGVPMLREGVPIGVFVLWREQALPFTPRQVELVETFADQAVIAIENVRLFRELQDRNRELTEALEQQTATSEVLKVISRSTFDLQPVLDTLVENAARLCGAKWGEINRLEGAVYRGAAVYRFPPEFKAYLEQHPMPPGRSTITGRVALERRAIQIPDVLADPDYDYGDGQKLGGYRTLLGVPMLREGAPIGVIVLSRGDVEPFTARQIELVETFADQAVIAIENVRLFREIQQRTRDLEASLEEVQALSEVGRAVSSTLELGQVLHEIAEQAAKLCDADAGMIYEYLPATAEFRPTASWQASQAFIRAVEELQPKLGRGATGQSAATGRPVQIPDILAEPDYPYRQLLAAEGYRAVLSVPMQRDGRTLGTVVVLRKAPGPFSERQINLLTTFADQTTIAIEHARLFRQIEEKSAQLEIASRHKSQFLANMSHELRTPLNAILGYTELILDDIYGPVSDKVREVLVRLERSGRHLLNLINDVLDLSKIEAGQLTLSLGAYSIRDVVQTVFTAVESLAADKRLALKAIVPADLPVGSGDERRIIQVFLNLVGNAIKFTEAGEVTVEVRMADADFLVSITDTGPGIAPEDQQKIFEEFHQVDSSSTRAKGGTGLGLAIVRRIVRLHGGQIWVDSSVGRGSTFWLTLPIRVERQAEGA